MILLIDNYDSFTYNLYHLIAKYYDDKVVVIKNDELTLEEIEKLENLKAIVISPGPKTPKESNICLEVIEKLYTKYPILGICLGHQAIGYVFGAEVINAKTIMHGKTDNIVLLNKDNLFKGCEKSISCEMRYHSLAISNLPECLEPLAISSVDGTIMAVKHKEYPVYGLQFHLESFMSENGEIMMQNFLANLRG